ncbi:MAG TPA: O-antigen ligase family protein [Anaeromyxobacter sp.]
MTPGAQAARGEAPGAAPVVALVAVGGATALAALLGAGPAATAAPVTLAIVIWAVWIAPLRASAGVLAFLLLALDDRWNANGRWASPLAPLGDLLRLSLRVTVPGVPLPISGEEIAIAFLLGIAAWRRSRGERVPGQAACPPRVRRVALLFLGALGLGIAIGLLHGGSAEVAVWQTRPLATAIALFFLFEVAFRGTPDVGAIARVVVAAAVVRAALAVWARFVVFPGVPGIEYVTDHGDSMLFSLAFVIVVAHLVERADRRRFQTTLVLLPILMAGMVANQRRTAWVQVVLGLVTFLVTARAAPWRRQAARAALVAAPALLLYGAAGWGSASPAFKPVRLVRSIVDSKVDRSTWDRQVENWNLAMSMRERPLTGRGFGHEWTQYMASDDIEAIFSRYRAEPHNQVLGILLFGGPLGFVGVWAPLSVLVLLARRTYPRLRAPDARAAALAVGATAVIVAVQFFGDLGPFWPQYAVLLALALATGGKLAAETGALR